jgi:hypothetical protein
MSSGPLHRASSKVQGRVSAAAATTPAARCRSSRRRAPRTGSNVSRSRSSVRSVVFRRDVQQ